MIKNRATITITIENCSECPLYSDGGGFDEPWCRGMKCDANNGKGVPSWCEFSTYYKSKRENEQ